MNEINSSAFFECDRWLLIFHHLNTASECAVDVHSKYLDVIHIAQCTLHTDGSQFAFVEMCMQLQYTQATRLCLS